MAITQSDAGVEFLKREEVLAVCSEVSSAWQLARSFELTLGVARVRTRELDAIRSIERPGVVLINVGQLEQGALLRVVQEVTGD